MNIIYSLIIPHYNIPDLLKRLLDTIPKRDDLQVIVVDDCSTKDVEKLNRLQEEYDWIEWYSTGTNGGGGKARNIGLDHAKGKYILFADADDFFTPGISIILDRYKESDYEMIIFSAISLNSQTYQLSTRATQLENRINLYYKNVNKGTKIFKYLFGEPWCRLIKASLIFENNIQFQEVKCHNDTKFSYLAGHYVKKLKVDITVGYVITFRSNSVVNTNYKDRYEIEVDVFSEKQIFFLENNIHVHIEDLYYPLVHDLSRGKISSFIKKYKYIKNRKPQIPLASMIIKQILIAIMFKTGIHLSY